MIRYLIFACCLLAVNATLPTSFQAWRTIERHNYYRERTNPHAVNMPAYYRDASLEASSNAWAQQCKWQHSGTPNVGENLYATTERVANPADFNLVPGVTLWGDEGPFYNYQSNTCASGQICGHYTQIIWASSTLVGCAFQDCPVIQGLSWPNGGTIMVCQYKPPGNFIGQRPFVQANWNVAWQLQSSLSWNRVSYKGNQLWALDSLGKVYQNVAGTWTLRNSNAHTSVSASPDGWAWVTTSSNTLSRWNPSTSSWQSIPLPSGSSGAGQVDAISKDSAIIYSTNTGAVYLYWFGGWSNFGGVASSVAIGYGNDAWRTDPSGNIHRWIKSDYAWLQMPGSGARSISVTDLQNIVYVNTTNRLFRYNGGNWDFIPASVTQASAANAKIYAVGTDKKIYVDQ